MSGKLNGVKAQETLKVPFLLRRLAALLLTLALAAPSNAHALRPASVEGAGLEELKRKLFPSAGVEEQIRPFSRAQAARLVRRGIFGRDPAAWDTVSPKAARDIVRWLGWSTAPETYWEKIGEIEELVRQAGELDQVVLIGSGGSLWGALTLTRLSPRLPGSPELIGLDLTDPSAIERVEKIISGDFSRTLFVVSSKSGTTPETTHLHGHFRALLERFYSGTSNPRRSASRHFVAITDPERSIEGFGEEDFLKVFHNDPEIGGRFSSLSYFGLVPAALSGVDIRAALEPAVKLQRQFQTRPESLQPVFSLVQVLLKQLRQGRDKWTVRIDPKWGSLGPWLQQLLNESLGKRKKAPILMAEEADELVPEPDIQTRDGYRIDLQEAKGRSARLVSKRSRLIWKLKGSVAQNLYELEMAIPLAAYFLGVHPFDQPGVERSKEIAREILAQPALLEGFKPVGDFGAARFHFSQPAKRFLSQNGYEDWLDQISPPDYLAILAYTFDEMAHPKPDLTLDRVFREIRLRMKRDRGIATLTGVGTRFQHSDLQALVTKKGVWPMLLTFDSRQDIRVTGKPYTFAQFTKSQAMAQFRRFEQLGIPALWIELPASYREDPSMLLALFPSVSSVGMEGQSVQVAREAGASNRLLSYAHMDAEKFKQMLERLLNRPLATSEREQAKEFIQAMSQIREKVPVAKEMNEMLDGVGYPDCCVRTTKMAIEFLDQAGILYRFLDKNSFIVDETSNSLYPFNLNVKDFWWGFEEGDVPIHFYLVIRFLEIPLILELSGDQFLKEPGKKGRFVDTGIILIPVAELKDQDWPYVGGNTIVPPELRLALQKLVGGNETLLRRLIGGRATPEVTEEMGILKASDLTGTISAKVFSLLPEILNIGQGLGDGPDRLEVTLSDDSSGRGWGPMETIDVGKISELQRSTPESWGPRVQEKLNKEQGIGVISGDWSVEMVRYETSRRPSTYSIWFRLKPAAGMEERILFDESVRGERSYLTDQKLLRNALQSLKDSDVHGNVSKEALQGIQDARLTGLMDELNRQLDLKDVFWTVLMHLWPNAADAVNEKWSNDLEKAEIHLRIFVRNQNIWIEVTDNGLGIPEENLSNLGKTQFTTKKNGNGYGKKGKSLLQVGEIMERLGGKLEIGNRTDGRQGARVAVGLPVSSELAAQLLAGGEIPLGEFAQLEPLARTIATTVTPQGRVLNRFRLTLRNLSGGGLVPSTVAFFVSPGVNTEGLKQSVFRYLEGFLSPAGNWKAWVRFEKSSAEQSREVTVDIRKVGASAGEEEKDLERMFQRREPIISVPYRELFEDVAVLYVGDTHTNVDLKRELIRATPIWKQLGVTHLFLEALDKERQPVLDAYFKADQIGEIRTLEEKLLILLTEDMGRYGELIPSVFLELIKAAKQNGIRVVAINLNTEQMTTGEAIRASNAQMAELVSRDLSAPEAGKGVVFAGIWHFGYGIPHGLSVNERVSLSGNVALFLDESWFEPYARWSFSAFPEGELMIFLAAQAKQDPSWLKESFAIFQTWETRAADAIIYFAPSPFAGAEELTPERFVERYGPQAESLAGEQWDQLQEFLRNPRVEIIDVTLPDRLLLIAQGVELFEAVQTHVVPRAPQGVEFDLETLPPGEWRDLGLVLKNPGLGKEPFNPKGLPVFDLKPEDAPALDPRLLIAYLFKSRLGIPESMSLGALLFQGSDGRLHLVLFA